MTLTAPAVAISSSSCPSVSHRNIAKRATWLCGAPLLAASLGAAVLIPSLPAQAVRLSAHTSPTGSNSMALPLKPVVPFDPGFPSCTGLASLPVVVAGTNTDTVNCGFGNGGTAMQMSGDGISTVIWNPGTTLLDFQLVLTNFKLISNTGQGNSSESLFVNVWETFTGLPTNSIASWAGPATISGSCTLSSGPPLESALAIAVATADNGTAWTAVSAPFGTVPFGCGAITGSSAVIGLTPFIIGGNLTLGLELALGLVNADNTFDSLVLPTSLELKLRYDLSGSSSVPVPGPLPLPAAALAFGFSRRLRQRHTNRQRA